MATHIKIAALSFNYGMLHNTFTDTHHVLHYTNTKYQSSYTARTPEVVNETMEEVDEETRLHRRRVTKRNNPKMKREQLKYHKIILESTQQQFFEAQKISFWDGDKDSGEWQSGVIQFFPCVK